MDETRLVEYACQRFEEEKYDEALEAFVLAYCKGCECERIIENIYACYMSGNDGAFREAYRKQIFESNIAYEDCTLDFIPYKDGVYYVFDRDKAEFYGHFSVHELAQVKQPEVLKQVEFSAAAIEFNGDWRQYPELLAEAKHRKVYAVCHDMELGMSYWKIPELEQYLSNVQMFPNLQTMQQYFHTNTGVYLPKIVWGENQKLSDLFEQEHAYRLTPEGRNTDHVLLTIGIPTYHRGNLLIKRMENLCKMSYDAEIEFSVSKHGTSYYEDEYRQVEVMTDARINYHAHDRELKALENWYYTVEMSHGKYVLFVSDEDDVLWGVLEHYLKLLQQNEDVNLIRAKTTIQYGFLDEEVYGKKGFDAFQAMFLRQNYLSGLIVRREDFLKADLLQLERFSDNDFYIYYPHEWWCAQMSRYGDYMEEPVTLIRENESVRSTEIEKKSEDGTLPAIYYENGVMLNIPPYATYDARLKQLNGEIGFAYWFMKGDMQGIESVLWEAFGKTAMLLEMARKCNYAVDTFEEAIDRFLWICMDTIDRSPLDEMKKLELLQWAQKLGIDAFGLHKRLSEKEIAQQ